MGLGGMFGYHEDRDPTGEAADRMFDLHRDIQREREAAAFPSAEELIVSAPAGERGTWVDTLLSIRGLDGPS
jgi:hypothetical protein